MRFPRPASAASLALALAAASVLTAAFLPVRPLPAVDGAAPKPGAGDSDAVLKAAMSLYDGIRAETLPNGLWVYLKPIPGAPTVTTMVAYKVGSCDEDKRFTGLAHYLEHLMFKGTEKIKPGDIDRATLRNGGANNAYTSEDMTVYHFDFASDRWETALEIEADRMRNIRIDAEHEFEQEKGAVCAELERDEDRPYDLEYKMIVGLLFENGPYGHPVIGQREHVRAATAEVIKGYYDRWYHPNNAALVVVGGFDPDKALAKIKTVFGPIPEHKLPDRKPAVAVSRDKPVAKTFESKFDVPRMLMGFNGVAVDDPDMYPLEVIQGVLSRGKTARLYKALVEGAAIANEASAYDSPGRYPGYFAVQLELLQGKDPAEAEKLVLAQLAKLADEDVPAAELARVKRGLLADTVFGLEDPHALADSIARGVTLKDADYVRGYIAKIAAVTPADIRRAAKKYLDPQKRVVVWSLPKKGEEGKDGKGKGGNEKSAPEKKRHDRSAGTSAHSRSAARHSPARDAAGAGGPSLTDAKRVVLDNGLTLLLFENRRLPIVVAEAYIKGTRLLEPADKAGVAALTGTLLSEGGDKHTGPQIAELIEGVGGSLSSDASGVTVQALSTDRPLPLGLLFECLIAPKFPAEAFEREKARALSDIEDEESQPDKKAAQTYREMVYGAHPLGRPGHGRKETVSKLTREDCSAFHKAVAVPGNVIVAVVGDFDAAAVAEEIKKLTADWKGAAPAKPNLPAVAVATKTAEKIISMPEAAQLALYMGHLGINRKDPDYHKLLVTDYVFGTGPGFTDRLSARLRDREGLAYTVRAGIAGSADEEPGLFTFYIGTEPKHFERVRKEFLEELTRLRTDKPTDAEVADAKSYLLGSLAFSLNTNGKIAGQLLTAERLGLGLGYLDDYRKAVAVVTPEDVLAVAKKRLDPAALTLVAAGAVGPDGKPLPKEEKKDDKEPEKK